MSSSIIAVVFDCDDTLCSDTTSLLLEGFGINPKDFWGEINDLNRNTRDWHSPWHKSPALRAAPFAKGGVFRSPL